MGGKVVKGLGFGLFVAGSCWLGWTVWSWATDRSDQISAVGVIVGFLVPVVTGLSAWLWPRQPAGNAAAPGQSIGVERSIRVGHQEGGVNITGDQNTMHIDRGGDSRYGGGDPRRSGGDR